MIKLDKISFAYENSLIIDKFSADIGNGEAVMITGDNGCGKSTLMKILNGIYFPFEGNYYFDSKEINKKSMSNPSFAKTFHSKIGYVFQNTDAQLFCSDVESEIAFGIEQMNMPKDEIDKRVEDMIRLFDLEKLRHRAPYTLSAGEKKKVATASVLITNPDVFMLDEPLSGLDKKSREFLTDFLIKLKQAGKTIIAVTHDETLVKAVADKEIKLD